MHKPYEQLTNFEKWRIFTKGLKSPDSFIDFGFYFLISSALQRRVWCPPAHKPVYPNQFVTYVAPPGIGKGLVTSTINQFLRYHRMPDQNLATTQVNGNKVGDVESVDRHLMEAEANINSSMAEYGQVKTSSKYTPPERPTILPVAPDASTYAALVTATARALRLKRYVEFDPKLNRNKTNLYTHSSITFCLEEVSSMFRKHAEDVVYFLQQAYDCGDYSKDTKSQGCDRIQKCCVNIIGGTTPETMRKIFRDGLLNEGYASRCIHIFEGRNRRHCDGEPISQVFITELDDIQKRCQDDLLAWILKLTDLYGQVNKAPEVDAWIEQWWLKQEEQRAGISDKLLDYYARKPVHTIKMAMAIHFAESLDMNISLDSFVKASKLLESVEDRMHLALVHTTENPLYKIGIKIRKFLEDTGPQTKNSLMARFYEELPGPDPKISLDKCLEYDVLMGKVTEELKQGKYYFGVTKL